MHDRDGKLVKVGDIVNIPCVLLQCSGDENFCSADLETVEVMPGNGQKNRINALSTKQLVLVESK